MGVKFKSPLELSGHRSILHTDAAQTLVVKVISKTTAHPEQGNGSSSGYTIDGVEGAYLEFTPGNTYKFDQSDNSNSNHPLRFYTDAAKTTAYTTGVTTSGTAGNSGAYTQIIPTTSTPPVLFYQCSAHSLMGSYVKFGTATAAGSNTTYTINSVTSGSDAIIRLTGSDSSTDDVTLEAGNNITISETGDTITIASTASGSVTEAFKTISVSGQSDVVADSATDTLTLAAGSNVTITTTAGSDTITFASTDTNTTYTAGTGISLAGTTFALNAAIENLTNVSSSSPSSGQVLKWDGSQWAPGTDSAGAGASNSFETIAIAGQTSVVADSATDTLTLVAGDNITLTTNASTDTITVASSGGSSQLVAQKNTFTGNGSATAYTLSSTIADEARTQVYIDGVYQSKDTYSTSGTTLTFSAAPPNTAAIEIIHFTTLAGGLSKVDTFTGNGSTTAFAGSMSINDENNTQIYIDGVYQSKSNYSTSGSTVTFSTAPPNGSDIELVHFKELSLSGMSNDTFTGNGSATAFTLGAEVTDENNTWVFINGVYQDKSVYSISGTTLTFSTAPQNGYGIEVMKLGNVSVTANALVTNSFTGNSSTTAYTLGVTPASLHAVNAYISGLRQDNSTLSLSGNTLTFSTAPPSGASIEIRSIGGINATSVVTPSSVTAGTGISVANPSEGNFVITNTLSTDYSVSVINSATTAVKNTLYVFTGSAALTLPAGVVGNSIKVSNRSGTTTCTILPNGTNKIMGSNTTMTLDTATASFELIYSGTAQGWVIIGQ